MGSRRIVVKTITRGKNKETPAIEVPVGGNA
jgi:hypothetical protein